jgi:EAL domain-containing protein (putative c-di-GMP-specific phosphodiesterase class I)
VIALAHALGMRVVAEGVDSAEALTAVADLECETAQGFFIARPMRGSLVPDWIEQYQAATNRKVTIARDWHAPATA